MRLGKDKTGEWLEIEDNGIGMSEQVLRRYLLDFANTYWGSTLMLQEFPGLFAGGMKPIGKYGIGFFSIFMLGSAVRVRTRRADASQTSTLVLEFNTGLTTRPVIRHAETSELLKDGGTAVRAWLEKPSLKPGGLLSRGSRETVMALAQLCRTVCPCLDVSVWASEHGKNELCIKAGDWTSCEASALLKRLPTYGKETKRNAILLERLARNLRVLKNADGEIVGRACITPESYSESYPGGAVTVGGLRACHVGGITGVLAGSPSRASRDFATPSVKPAVLASWASEQAKLIPSAFESPKEQEECARYVRRFGGETADLPIAKFRGRWWSFRKFASEENLPNEVYFVWSLDIERYEQFAGFKIANNVIQTEFHGWGSILSSNRFYEWPQWPDKNFMSWKCKRLESNLLLERTLGGAVIEALVIAWKTELVKVLNNSELWDREKVRIGTLDGRPVMADAVIIRRRKPRGR